MHSQDQINSNRAFVASLDDQGISEFWHLCDVLTVKQAALLIIGIDPSSETGAWLEDWQEHLRPRGYEPVKQAISAALRGGFIKGVSTPDEVNVNPTEPEWSTVERESLLAWLRGRGIKSGFFFPKTVDTPDYLDPRNARFAPKLAAAVGAWLSVEDPGAKSPKQALDKWLREHAVQFGLTDDEGKVNETAIEECAKVANWRPGGGAPKTPGG